MNIYKTFNNSGQTLTTGLLFIICVLAVVSCAPKITDAPAEPEPLITYEQPFGPTVSLDQLLKKTLRNQYSSMESVFEVPVDTPDQKLILLTQEKPVLFVESGVTAFAADDEFLAAGYADGNIRIWSELPCPVLALPKREAVQRLWRDRSSPYLSAAGSRNPAVINIYDLNKCAMVAIINADAPADDIAVSPRGTYLAMVDTGRRLWTGNLRGNLEQQAGLRFDPLDMTFSPKEGVLILVDQAGWMLLWTTPDYSLLEQTLIPGGPFDKGTFLGPELILQKAGETTDQVVWDIPDMKILADRPKTGRFHLENEILNYTLPDRQPVKKVHMSGPFFRLMADSKSMTFKILDVDGKTKYYDAVTGSETKGVSFGETLNSVNLPPSGQFTWSGVEYSLADPVIIKGQWALWCRYIPDQGFYLWWALNPGLVNKNFNQELPVRENIRREIPPVWTKLKEQVW